MSCKVDELITHLGMACNDNPPVIAVDSVTHGKGVIATITFILEVRGVKIVTCTQKVTKFYGSEYCTGYHINPYGQTVTHMFGKYKEKKLEWDGNKWRTFHSTPILLIATNAFLASNIRDTQ